MLEFENTRMNMQMKLVALRWRRRRKETNQPKVAFEAYARETLLSYGWSEDEVAVMMKTIMEDLQKCYSLPN